jgi:nucleoside phosphorylase
MEAYGVFYAAEKAKLYSNTKAIVIKSICDFANEEKDDSYHHFASHASARTMYKLFTEYVF